MTIYATSLFSAGKYILACLHGFNVSCRWMYSYTSPYIVIKIGLVHKINHTDAF